MASSSAGEGSGSGEFADDDAAHEVAQRRHAAVMPVGREVARAPQARDAHRIEHVVVGLGIEEGTRGVERARAGRHAGNEQLGVARPGNVAGAAADAGTACDVAEDRWRVEGEVAERDHVGGAVAVVLRAQDLMRHVDRVFVELAAGRQHRLVPVDRKRVRVSRQHQQHGERYCGDGNAPPPGSSTKVWRGGS